MNPNGIAGDAGSVRPVSLPDASGQPGGGSRKPLSEAEAERIRDSVAAMERGEHPAKPGGRVRAIIILFVARSAMIPIFVFFVVPQRAAAAAAPLASKTVQQLAIFTTQIAALATQMIQQINRPLETLGKLGNELTSSFRASIERIAHRFQQMTDSFLGGLARLTQPLRQLSELLSQQLDHALKQLARLAQMPKRFANAMMSAVSNWAQKMGERIITPFNRLREHLSDAAEKLRSQFRKRLERGEERLLDPVKKGYESLAKAVETATAAVITQLQSVAQPVINFFAAAALFGRQLEKGSWKGFAQIMNAVTSKAQSAMRNVNHFVSKFYQQVFIEKMLVPMMAPLKHAFDRAGALQQRLQAKVRDRFNQMRGKVLLRLTRAKEKIQKTLASLGDRAKKKWREKWLPKIRKIPQQAMAYLWKGLRFGIGFWRSLCRLLLQIAYVLKDICRYLAEMMKEAITEIIISARSQT